MFERKKQSLISLDELNKPSHDVKSEFRKTIYDQYIMF